MSSTTTEFKTFKSNGEIFETGFYHKISILIRKSDGYVNATKLCEQFNKRFRDIIRNQSWKDYYDEFMKEYASAHFPADIVFIDNCLNSYSNDFRD